MCLRKVIEGEGKVRPRRSHEGPEREKMCSSTLSLISALDEGRWLASRPSHVTPGKETRYPFYKRYGGPQNLSGRVRKVSPHVKCYRSTEFKICVKRDIIFQTVLYYLY